MSASIEEKGIERLAVTTPSAAAVLGSSPSGCTTFFVHARHACSEWFSSSHFLLAPTGTAAVAVVEGSATACAIRRSSRPSVTASITPSETLGMSCVWTEDNATAASAARRARDAR
eukprot:3888602-Prymnesium_polylepis.1